MNLAIKLVALASAATFAIGAAPVDEGAHDMNITRKEDLVTVEGPEAYFTGKATITGQFTRDEPSRLTGAIVHFEPGARTAWHAHPMGQTLIVTQGVGWTQIEGGGKYEFHEGDILWCPADTKHWHGATPHEGMTHIALQEMREGTNVTWMEKVTDAEYLAPLVKD